MRGARRINVTWKVCWTLAAFVAFLAACDKGPTAPKTASTGNNSQHKLTISAAASTREAMEAICDAFTKSSGIQVSVNSGGSNALAAQILSGAPADLFLSANEKWAKEVKKTNLAEISTRLLTNRLVIAVPKGNPGGVHQPVDLLSDKVTKLALAGENVPAGMYADQALVKLELLQPLTNAGRIVRGADVRATLSYLERGEAEAGVVYSTDVKAGTNVEVAYEFDAELHDEIVYILVLLQRGGANPAARKLYDYLQSPASDRIFQQYGFTRLASGSKVEKHP